MALKELYEERGQLEKQLRDLIDTAEKENRDLTAEEDQQFRELHDRDTALRSRIARQEQVDSITRELDSVRDHGIDRRNFPASAVGSMDDRDHSEPTEEERCLALQAWFRSQLDKPLKRHHKEALRKCRLSARGGSKLALPIARTSTFREAQSCYRDVHPSLVSRALSAITFSAGGATAPKGFVNSLEKNMLAYGGMLQVAQVIRTDNGNDMSWPTADDTSNEGEIVGESSDVDGSTDPEFGAVVWKAHKFSSKMIKVPTELLEDSAFDLASELGEMIGERLGRKQNREYTTGPGGGNRPRGLLTAATLGVTTASATAIADTELMDLIHSIDPAYRSDAGFMFHDNILLHIRKIKDLNGQFVFQSGLQAGVPDRLLGYVYTPNQHMPSSVATGNKTILFGQFSKYKVRQVRDIRFRRLTERYAHQDQEAFIAFLRADGNLLQTGTAPVKYLQQQ